MGAKRQQPVKRLKEVEMNKYSRFAAVIGLLSL